MAMRQDSNIWRPKVQSLRLKQRQIEYANSNIFKFGRSKRGLQVHDFIFMPHKLILWLYLRVLPKYLVYLDYGGDNERMIRVVIWLGPWVTVLMEDGFMSKACSMWLHLTYHAMIHLHHGLSCSSPGTLNRGVRTWPNGEGGSTH